MLNEPEQDPRRLALDRAVVQAVRARMDAGCRPRPDAEAIALRQLLSDLSGSEQAIMRTLLGRIEARDMPPLFTSGPLARVLAADRWGLGHGPMEDADQALRSVLRGGRALIDLGHRPWWGRLLAMPGLRVIGALPDDAAGQPHALLVSAEASGPTGDDRTFWVTDSDWPDKRIAEALAEQGLFAGPLTAAGGLKLFVLTGYVQAEDPRLEAAPGRLRGVIGAAPVY